MKYLFLIILLTGCMINEPKVVNESGFKGRGNFNIKVIDSCEYIIFDDGIFDQRVFGITHKGNCKFCKLRNK